MFFNLSKRMTAIITIGIAAMLGAWLRWGLGILFNPIFPTIPLGTLAANLLGGFLMGLFMALTKDHLFLSATQRLGVATGFLGSLTTFSTFSAETVTLLSHHEYLFSSIIIVGHLFGTILATFAGIFTVKLFTN